MATATKKNWKKKTDYVKEECPFTYADILEEALNKPGQLAAIYRSFHSYSIGNVTGILYQCAMRGIEPGPIGAFGHWKKAERSIKADEKALWACQPIPKTFTKEVSREDGTKEKQEVTFHRFEWRKLWFVLSQTEGKEFSPEDLNAPDWNHERALKALNITQEKYDSMYGGRLAYATGRRTVAVSPITEAPLHSLVHEIAHVLMHLVENEEGIFTDNGWANMPHSLLEVEADTVAYLVCTALGVTEGQESSRAYIQHYAQGKPIEAKTAERIFATAQKILKAGKPEEEKE